MKYQKIGFLVVRCEVSGDILVNNCSSPLILTACVRWALVSDNFLQLKVFPYWSVFALVPSLPFDGNICRYSAVFSVGVLSAAPLGVLLSHVHTSSSEIQQAFSHYCKNKDVLEIAFLGSWEEWIKRRRRKKMISTHSLSVAVCGRERELCLRPQFN